MADGTARADIRMSTRKLWKQNPAVDCCTSCAIAACFEAMRTDFGVLSPIFHYHLSGCPAARGLNPHNALVLAEEHGLPLYTLHPHGLTPDDLAKPPSREAIDDASTRRLMRPVYYEPTFERLSSVDLQHHLYGALASGNAILLAIWLNQQYETMRHNAIWEWDPAPGLRTQLHVVAVIGYERATARFIVQDSRGRDFGKGGQWYLAARRCDSRMIYEAFEIKRLALRRSS